MGLNAGTYTAKAESAALGYTKTGKEQVAVELVVLDEHHLGERITWYGYFTEATTERTLDSLRHLGWRGDNLFDLSGIGDREVSIVVEEEEYEGKRRAKVRWVNAKGGLALSEPMTDEQAKAFAARMKGEVLAHMQKLPPAPPPSSGDDAPPPHSDEDFI